MDALMGGIAEYLSKQHALAAVPAWTRGPTRRLDAPWFTTSAPGDWMREYLTHASPSEFRHRNIFTEAMSPRRASQRGPGHGS